mmetsp:Transcript_52435/g.93607  ORF Transcript_52435/g.93607 Transcript_52435/m.93607 type:complete len:127 (+) Transcript_52435:2343-2723(+)
MLNCCLPTTIRRTMLSLFNPFHVGKNAIPNNQIVNNNPSSILLLFTSFSFLRSTNHVVNQPVIVTGCEDRVGVQIETLLVNLSCHAALHKLSAFPLHSLRGSMAYPQKLRPWWRRPHGFLLVVCCK